MDTETTLIRKRLAATGKHFYCICFTVRSGSTLLCHDLTQQGLGAPTEYFQFEVSPIEHLPLADYLVQLVEGTAGDYFGLKLTWQQTYELTRRLREQGDTTVSFDLRTVFPGLRYIHLIRADKVGQAVSLWRAVTSDIWHAPVGSSVDRPRLQYDFPIIKQHFLQLVVEDWLWKTHFQENSIRPFVLTYEDYCNDRMRYLRLIADHLHAPISLTPLKDSLILMRDDWTDEVVQLVKTDLEAPHQPYWVTETSLVETLRGMSANNESGNQSQSLAKSGSGSAPRGPGANRKDGQENPTLPHAAARLRTHIRRIVSWVAHPLFGGTRQTSRDMR